MNKTIPSITMSEVTDPAEIAAAQARREKFDRNIAWLEAHAAQVYQHRGKFYCISEGEAFVADTVDEAVAHARAAHPDDDGRFTGYIPLHRVPRVYANRW